MSGHRGALVAMAGFSLALLTVAPAAAKVADACAAEVEKYCPDVPPGGGRLVTCLLANTSKLSPACQQVLEEHRQRGSKRRTPGKGKAAWARSCMGDIKKLCAGVPAGAGRIAECLTQHQSELSDACKAVFPPKKSPSP